MKILINTHIGLRAIGMPDGTPFERNVPMHGWITFHGVMTRDDPLGQMTSVALREDFVVGTVPDDCAIEAAVGSARPIRSAP